VRLLFVQGVRRAVLFGGAGGGRGGVSVLEGPDTLDERRSIKEETDHGKK
jgi:hypothetical protein